MGMDIKDRQGGEGKEFDGIEIVKEEVGENGIGLNGNGMGREMKKGKGSICKELGGKG